MKLNRFHLASTAALGLLAVVGFSGQAHAGAFAFSTTEVDAFMISNVVGNALGGTKGTELTSGTEITVLSASSPLTTAANLNGNPGTPVVTPVLGGFLKTDCIGNNCGPVTAAPFSLVGAPPPINGQFSQSAAQLQNAVIIGVNGSVAGGATAKTAAQSQITGNNAADSNGEAQVAAGFNFSLANAGGPTKTIDISFSALSHLLAGLDIAGATSQATTKYEITISQGTTTLFDWTPNGKASGATGLGGATCDGTSTTNCDLILTGFNLNQNVQQNIAGDPNNEITNLLANFEIQVTLPTGTNLSFSIAQIDSQQTTSASLVPEPSTVALFAGGLLCLGFVTRRRSPKA